jgi:hypothetical protein
LVAEGDGGGGAQEGGEGGEGLAGFGIVAIRFDGECGGLDGSDAEPGVGFAGVAIDDFEVDGLAFEVGEIPGDGLEGVAAGGEGGAEGFAVGVEEANEVAVVGRFAERAAMAAEVEG